MDYTIKANEVIQKENTLIVISDDVTDETVLAVLAAIQAYESSAYAKVKGSNTTHNQNVKLELSITLVCANEDYDFIWQRCLTKLDKIIRHTSGEVDITGEHFTYVALVSIEAARNLGNKTKHIADLLGILLGAETSSLPDVSNLITEYKVAKRNWYVFNSLETLWEKFETSKKYNSFVEGKTFQEKTLLVFESCAIFGYSSYETYLACALKKPVIEIQKDQQLYKWSNPNYICITDESDQEAVQKAIDKCCSLLAK